MRLAEILKQKFDMSLSMPVPGGIGMDAHEMPLSDMIPYTVHYDDNTVITKDDGLVQVIKLDGLYYESLSAQEIKVFEKQRNTILRSIANSNRGIYVHLIRRKMNSYPGGDGGAWFSKKFNEAWRQRYEKRNFYVNEIYISIVRNRFRQGTPGVIDRLVNIIAGNKSSINLEFYEDQEKDIYEASNMLVKSLSAYGARRLTIQRHPDFVHEQVLAANAKEAIQRFRLNWTAFQKHFGHCSFYNRDDLVDYLGEEFTELGEFFHYLINLEKKRVPVASLQLDQMLASSRLNFKTVSNLMEVRGLVRHHAGAVLSMAEWPTRTPSHMLDAFLKLPVEFIITQSFFFTDRITAEHGMRTEKRRLSVNDKEGLAEEDTEDIKQGLKDLSRGRSVNGLHHLTMFVHVPTHQPGTISNKRLTVQELDTAIGHLENAFVGLGVKATREFFGVETFFWSQLPGQPQKYIGRRGQIKSANFAGFASLHNFSTGKIDGNLWGDAIMPFETESGTAYHFNFHRELEGMVAGHTAITAETGAGKTALLAALITMADKARPRITWFDNRLGAKVFMAAMGGKHTILSVMGSSGWNPCRLAETDNNKVYLVELFTLMRTCYGGELKPDDIECFKQAVIENYLLPSEDRRLRNIAWCFGQGTLGKDMSIWYGTGANAGVFDNERDEIDLTSCQHHCFEMQQLMKGQEARPELPVILSYPFHRIEQAMDGQPFIIVLEEGQNLVKHAYWREKIDNYIMQIRRKNGILIFVTPDAKYLYCETDSIKKQTVTKLFLPNGNASKEDSDALGLTQAEHEFIKETPPESRKFLIRRGNESIKAIFDLGDMPEFIPVLSSNDKGVALMESIVEELGTDDPERWVPVFMQRAIEQNTHNLRVKGI